MQRSLIVILVGIAALCLYACSDKHESETSTASTKTQGIPEMRPVEPATGLAVSAAPWLRTVLPESAFAYVRIPSLWGLIGVPSGTVFDRAVGSQAYVDAVKSIRSGVAQTLLPEIGDDIEPLWQLLLAHARSPVEVAALASADPDAPMPEILLNVQLDFDSLDKLNQFLQQAAAADPVLTVNTPVGSDGRGILSLAGLPAFAKFDLKSRRLMLLAGSMSPAEALDKQLASMETVADHRMYKLESELDSGGQGLFMWMDPKRLMTVRMTPGSAAIGAVALMGTQDMQSIAFGMGSAGGKQRATMVLEMPAKGIRSFIPLVNADANVKAAGELRSVIMLGLPQVDDIKRIEAQLTMMVPPESMQNYHNTMASMKQTLGFDMKDMLAALGPEMIVLFDDAGSYLAVRLRDAAAFEQMIIKLQNYLGQKPDEKTIGGRLYQHLALPSFPDSEYTEMEKQQPGLFRLLMRVITLPSHFYWTREQDYLLISGTPQQLIDRYYIRQGVAVGSWLKRQQKLDPKNSLLLASGRSQGLPAFMYDLNLQVLLALGDLVDRPVDLFAFPTAREAGLPEYGGISFKMDSSETRLALEFSYDSNPGELLFGGGGMAAVAMTGILAAVAIPAYNDYTIRAKVSEGIGVTAQQRAEIANFMLNNKRLPTLAEGTNMLGEPDTDVVADWRYDDKSGAIIIQLAIDQFDDANLVSLTPQVIDNRVDWVCSAEIEQRYLPQSCRD